MGSFTNATMEIFESRLAALVQQAHDAGLDGRDIQSALVNAANRLIADLNKTEARALGYPKLISMHETVDADRIITLVDPSDSQPSSRSLDGEPIPF
jgi:hypothetical protein